MAVQDGDATVLVGTHGQLSHKQRRRREVQLQAVVAGMDKKEEKIVGSCVSLVYRCTTASYQFS
jgi:hypothetical protein